VKPSHLPTLLTAALLLLSQSTNAQNKMSNVEITTTDLGQNIYMLQGAGGNIGVSTGDDGLFIVDDQFAPLSEKILTALAALSDKPVSYVLNTHWHGDHTGGNENFGKAGAVIVAHENVRNRMSTKQFIKTFNREVPAAPEAALPVVTFSDNVNFYFNDMEISVTHMPSSHTDGDSIVYFNEPNVLHMGDTFFNGFFPFIDNSSGGTLEGMIATAATALAIVDDNTKIIPGHGPLAKKTDLEKYHSMMLDVQSAMQPALASGKTRDEVLAVNPLENIGKIWGNGFMKTEVFTGILFDIANDK